MKKLLVFMSVVGGLLLLVGCPSATGGGSTTSAVAPTVYAIGSVGTAIGTNWVNGYWAGAKWTALEVPTGTTIKPDNWSVSNGTVFTSGTTVTTATATTNYGYWSNGTWNALSPPTGTTINGEGNVVGYNGSAYILGYLNTAGPNWAGYWINNAWNSITGVPDLSYWVDSSCNIAVSGGKVYINGSVNKSSSVNTAIPGYWVGNTWSSLTLPSGCVYNSNSWVNHFYGLFLFGDTVYNVACLTKTSDGSMVYGFWAGNTWTQFAAPSGATVTVSWGTACVSGSTFYQGGSINGTAGYWANGVWNSPTATASGTTIDGINNAPVVSGNAVYLGGDLLSSAGTDYIPGYWTNAATWNPLTPATGYSGGSVSSLTVSGGVLYAAGGSTKLLNTVANFAAIPGYWLSGAWTPVTLPTGYPFGWVGQIIVQ